MNTCRTMLAGAVLLGMSVSQADAADRALLIGVGNYRDSTIGDLPGIDLDLGIMQRVVQRLGFLPANTRVLSDEEATMAAVERAMSEWLVDDVDPDDRVLIYYSGHGTQVADRNDDEADGLDEVLVLHDFSQNAEQGASGALVDDRFYELLADIPTDDVLLIVDACHSGSGYKSILGSLTGAERGTTKSHPAAVVANGASDSFTRQDKGSEVRFAALMASDDDELAIATSRGSMFTLGVEHAIEQAAMGGDPITPREIVVSATAFIQKALADSPQSLFAPQLGGSDELVDKPMRLASGNPDRDALEELIAGLDTLQVSTDKPVYRLGERTLKINVEVASAGYLNVLTVDPAGVSVVLYPNAFNPDNRVTPGKLTLPTEQMRFDLRADGPVGEHLIAAIWTPDPLDLYQAGFGERDAQGQLVQPLAEFSEFGSRAFSVVQRDSARPVRAGSTLVEMVP